MERIKKVRKAQDGTAITDVYLLKKDVLKLINELNLHYLIRKLRWKNFEIPDGHLMQIEDLIKEELKKQITG